MAEQEMKNKVAFFDIDGTIFRKNLAFELIGELVWMNVFPKYVKDDLVKLYANWLEHKGVYEDYRRALVELYVKHLKGCRESDLKKASSSVMGFHKERTYIFANQIIKDLRARDYHLVAISGSPKEIVEEFNKYLGFEAVFGSDYEVDNQGFYTGKVIFEPPHDKGAVVRQYIAEHQLTLDDSYGVGDTESDANMLSAVAHPIAFNPNENLKRIAESEGWRIVVEKKDVIYEINNHLV